MNGEKEKTICFLVILYLVTIMYISTGCSLKSGAGDNDQTSAAVQESTAVPATVGQSHNSEFYQSEASLSGVVSTKNSHFYVSRESDNADRRLAECVYEDVPTDITKEAYDAFMTFLDGVDVIYEYEPYYKIPEAHAEEAKYADVRKEQCSRFSEPVCDIGEIPSTELLTEMIEANSADYIAEHPVYDVLDAAERATIIRIIHEMVKDNYALFSEVDKRRIYSLLTDISIVGIDSLDFTRNDLRKPYNARVLEDGTIIIDLKSITTYLSDPIAREKTYEHEIWHLFQRMCPSAKEEGYYQIGPCQYFDALEVNPLHWNWLYEAAAEKKVMTHYGASEPLVYKNMIGYLKSLDLVTMLRDGGAYGERCIENATLTVDYEKMFDLLGAVTDREKNEIICLLYSIDIVQNNRDDFEKALNNGELLPADERQQVKRRLKEPICLSLTKLFYRNLAERVLCDEVSLQDVFYLINAFEEDINLHMYYDERAEDYAAFIREYTAIQDGFFGSLVKDGNADAGSGTAEENAGFNAIIEEFGTYAMAIRTPEGIERNCSLQWLMPEERNFLFEEMVTYNISYMTENIRDFR